MVALGGRGTIIGAIVGALSIEVASAYLSGSLPYVWELIIGVALVAVILAFPDGLVGLVKQVLRGVRGRPLGRGAPQGDWQSEYGRHALRRRAQGL